ncbi:MAG TPA: phosphoribosyl-ATP diphosphatase, partial [Clostridiales bacterium]|nr:phosphoribosyl-ATP diphosphatase [Clostridiales bacterium]
IKTDCDRDSLVIKVIKEGPACHLGTESCFSDFLFNSGDEKKEFSLKELYNLLSERKRIRPEGSYTTYLFDKGREKILKKVGEECSEVIIGAMKDSREETIYEISDLCYHVLVLMNEMNISVDEVKNELSSRHIIDKKSKQETMK